MHAQCSHLSPTPTCIPYSIAGIKLFRGYKLSRKERLLQTFSRNSSHIRVKIPSFCPSVYPSKCPGKCPGKCPSKRPGNAFFLWVRSNSRPNLGCGRHSPAITAASAPVSCPGMCPDICSNYCHEYPRGIYS